MEEEDSQSMAHVSPEPDPLDVLNDFAPVNVQIKSTESLKGVPSRNSQSNDDDHVRHEHHEDDDELFSILDVMDHSDKKKTTDTKSDIEIETETNTASNKHITLNKSPAEKALVKRTKSDSPRRRSALQDQIEDKGQPSTESTSLIGSPSGSAAALAPPEQESGSSLQINHKSPSKEKDTSNSNPDGNSSNSTAPSRPSPPKKGKDAKQMVEEAEAIAMQAKQNKLQQQQAQRELKEHKLGLHGNNAKKGAGSNSRKEADKDKDQDKKDKERERERERERGTDRNIGDKSDRPEATDRSEKETGRDRDGRVGKDKERKPPRAERGRSHTKQQDDGLDMPSEDKDNKLPAVKGANNSVQKLLSKVSNSTGVKGKGMADAEKRVNEKLAAAEKVRLPKISKTKAQALHQQQEKMMSKDDSHDEQEGNDDDRDGGDEGSVASRQSLLQAPPHSSPAGSQTSKRQGKSKKPLFMRMIAKARRQIMKEEQAKQEEYNKLKQNRPHRVPTRNELKEHMHKFNEMMKVHQEQQQKNHVENIRALRQARKKMEEKLGSIESVYVSDQEVDGVAGSGGEGEMMSEGSPSPKKKLKRQHREKNKDKDKDGIDGTNNNHDDDDSVITTESSPNKFQSSSSSSPLKKRYATPANKMEVISSAAPISPRSPRIPAGEKGNTKSGANSPRSVKTKKVKEVGEKNGERESSREGKSLFGADGDDEADSEKLFVDNKAPHSVSELATPRAVATEVTNDWLGRLLSAESLAMFD